jgi:hypothetical protein
MNIDRAKKLKRGDTVNCPADRGSAAFRGKVISVGEDVRSTPGGNEYIWVTIRGSLMESVWPSNRLS